MAEPDPGRDGFLVPPGLADAMQRILDEAQPVVAREHVVPTGEPLNPGDSDFEIPPGLRDHLRARYFGMSDSDAYSSYLDEMTSELHVTKHAAYISVPDELLMDYGVIPDTRERKPLPWRWRVRGRVNRAREWLARRAFKVIAGFEAERDDE